MKADQNPIDRWKNQIETTLQEKLSTLLSGFRKDLDKAIAELCDLSEKEKALEPVIKELEGMIQDLTQQMENDSKEGRLESYESNRKLRFNRRAEFNTRGDEMRKLQDRKAVILSKYTSFPVFDVPFLNFLSVWRPTRD